MISQKINTEKETINKFPACDKKAKSISQSFGHSILKGFFMPFQALGIAAVLAVIIGIMFIIGIPVYLIPFILIGFLCTWIFMYYKKKRDIKINSTD